MSKIYSNKILKVAKTWLNTKFHYYGRIKINKFNAGGVDCIGLIMKVGEEINAKYDNKNIIYYDYNTYSKYPNTNELENFLNKYFIKIEKIEAKIGDLLYFRFENNLEHIGIISDLGIIHCYIEAKKVVEHILDAYWKEKIIGYYRYNKNEVV